MVPPPPSLPDIGKVLGDAIRKLYKKNVPKPPPEAANFPAPPVLNLDMPSLTTADAPKAPTNVAKPPPLNPAVARRASIMIAPPNHNLQFQAMVKDKQERAGMKDKVNALVNAMSDEVAVDAKMVANKNAIKAALQKAIYERMVAKTRKVIGDQDIEYAQIDNKISLKNQLQAAQKEKKLMDQKI